MSVVVTVTETTGNTITVTTDEVIVTTNTLAIADASQIAITPVAGTDIDATNIQDALHQLADQKFSGASAPSSSDANLEEGDLWYDTANDEMKVHNGSSFVTFVSAYDTDDLSEGSSNLYYTNARADARITNAFNSNVTLESPV